MSYEFKKFGMTIYGNVIRVLSFGMTIASIVIPRFEQLRESLGMTI